MTVSPKSKVLVLPALIFKLFPEAELALLLEMNVRSQAPSV